MSQKSVLIKLGGSALQNDAVILKLVELVGLYLSSGSRVSLVHGGGPAINAELTKKGITWNFLNGQRITTPEMVETIEMVLKGQVNGKIVRALNSGGIPSVGLSGAENNLLLCEQSIAELQCVGRIVSVNTQWLKQLSEIKDSPVPVIAPLGVGSSGEVYNINADWAAAQIAMALKVDELIYLTDQKGIWDADKNILKVQTAADLQSLIDSGVVQGGMLAKTQTILAALQSGIGKIRILHAEEAVLSFKNNSVGTSCVLEAGKDTDYAAL